MARILSTLVAVASLAIIAVAGAAPYQSW